ncbi:MAG: DUF2723 domain-containing protein, partial [Mucilaginibacter sp.]|uniref:glycosyltransferase family 117 protein n=1 Tax=Mucilaginibacter sp. TaxID=1882438 RepID=UPI0031A803D0
QPGYPMFAMLGKAFSLLSFGDNTKVAYFTNLGSALASGATVMFLFWTITALAKKLLISKDETATTHQLILIMGAGLVGALAFTYTDTFWFSAVETIVFALSSLCTAVVFWAILKWDAHAGEPGADKWIVLIAYIIGLSIGIHLLNLLTIPAIAMVYYLRRFKTPTLKKGIVVFMVSIVILGLVQYGIREYTIKGAAYFDLFFVNSLGFSFGSGAVVFFLLIIAAITAGIIYSIKHKKPALNLALVCLAFIYFGYGSFAYIPIRASANTNLNNSHPDNAFTLNGYLNRIQYGETPLLYGPLYDAKIIDQTEGSAMYRKGRNRYEVAGKRPNYIFDHNTIIPRMHSTEGDSDFDQNVQFYKQWLNLADGHKPTFIDNMRWMLSWQMYQMYWRYFLWNFVGRYNDADGQTSTASIDGNWTSGWFDGAKHLPKSVTDSNTYTPLYALPLVVGLLGMVYHFRRKQGDATVVTLLWFFTGLAIVLYVNQANLQPRERDYSYVGSFYAFAIWIGLGVLAINDFVKRKVNARGAALASVVVCLLIAPVLLARQEWAGHDRSTKTTARDMAYNFLISCPKNAILFTYGDNDTYSLWYTQEVEGVRPDVRIVCNSLLGMDWYIRQMGHPMNQSAPLPITMPFDKYKQGVRDVIAYSDAKIPGSVNVKEVFDFITSDDSRTKVEYQNGETMNYLPTKNFKLAVNPDELVKNGMVTAAQKSQLGNSMEWTYNKNFMFKDNLAIMDILAHNNWKRPICFSIGFGQDNMGGLQPYMYKEGFVYQVIPFKADTSLQNQLSKVNSLVMYNNVMNKFRFGNFKHARYLDDVSKTQFYPYIETTFHDLAQGLIKDGHNDLALNALHKFDQEMPDINPTIDSAHRKLQLAQVAYRLNDKELANRYVKGIDDYLTDQLAYNYTLLQKQSEALNANEVQYQLYVLNGLADTAKYYKETALHNRFQAQLDDYGNKFAALLNRQ